LNGHRPSGPWRGGKYSKFEAGTRVPFLVRWPERVTPGVSNSLVCQVDLLASLAALTGQSVEQSTARDSENVLSALLGESPRGRDTLVEHAGGLSFRQGSWKLIEPSDGPKVSANTNVELGNDREVQLFNLEKDPGETLNVASEHPDRVTEMSTLLKSIREQP
jgi:arylsulfatase A-like enzyme